MGVLQSEENALPTPIDIKKFEKELVNYDPILKAKLVCGFKKGFDLGFRGYSNNNLNVDNLSSTAVHPEVVDKAIQK